MEYETLFPLYWICGEWKSSRKSPPVTVFRDGGTYKIALTYHLDAVVVGTIHQSGGIIWRIFWEGCSSLMTGRKTVWCWLPKRYMYVRMIHKKKENSGSPVNGKKTIRFI